MAHFAKVESGIVTDVIVISNDDCGGGEFPASEPVGQAFIASLGLLGEWKQTSYHSNFRNVYASVHYIYDSVNDVFYPSQPFPSWSLDDDFVWNPPTPMPTDGGIYRWNEAELEWVAI